jgi:hypothetical protein
LIKCNTSFAYGRNKGARQYDENFDENVHWQNDALMTPNTNSNLQCHQMDLGNPLARLLD